MTGEGTSEPDGLAADRRTVLKSGGAAAGAALATAVPAAAQEETLSYGDWFSDVSNFDGTVDRRGQDEVTVEVGVEANNGPYGFGPAAVRVDPGTTVVFEWVSDNHNVLPEDQPADADWAGEESLENSGYSYDHTFETEGLYLYFCDPHLTLGMKGAVVVGDAEVEAGGDDGGGDGGFVLPGGDPGSTMLLLGFGGAALAVLSVLVADFYSSVRRDPDEVLAAGETTEETPALEPAERIEHDDYDPVGTAALIVLYFLILAIMWVFVYFVEFLGRGPTVIG